MHVNQPGAHYDHMLKQTRQHHVHLSTMADVKANIMLTISSVILTMSMKYVSDPVLKWPAGCMMCFCVATITLAVYTVMPKINIWSKEEKKANPKSPFFNLLFFADFVRLPYDKYSKLMEEMLNDPSKAYEAQVKEIYSLGCFLASKKFRYVQLAYATFISGILLSTVTLIVSLIVNTSVK